MNSQETGAEIISEMRRAKTEFPFVYLMGEPDTPEVIDAKTKEIVTPRKINIRRVTVNELADRFEAAYKRECGDIAAMRKALDDATSTLESILDAFSTGTGGVYKSDVAEVIKAARAALALPPRNCDVGTVTDQRKRYAKMCQYNCDRCALQEDRALKGGCEFSWAQMPCEEGGVK